MAPQRLLLAQLLLALCRSAGSQQQLQIGPPTVAFLDLFVPDVVPSVAAGLPALLAERGDVSHVLMEFYAPWCPHCQHFAPEVERIGQAFNGRTSGVLVCRVNCVAQRPICEAMGIRSFPTMYWGGTAEFVAAERTRHWDSAGLVSVEVDPRNADSITAWINARSGVAPTQLSEDAGFEAELTARMEALLGSGQVAQQAAVSLNVWDVELAAIMSVQFMMSVPVTAQSKQVMVAFAELLSRNTAPLPQCQQGWATLRQFAGALKVGTTPLGPLMQSWTRPCGRPLTFYGSEQSDWGMCKGSYPTTRGYTCGLWSLFHMLTAHSDDDHALADLTTIRSWVENFFGCRECRDHFLAMSTGIGSSVRTRDDAVLWLWQAHNDVNIRLAGEQEAEERAGIQNLYKYDPAEPKIAWPSLADCPSCHRRCRGSKPSAPALAAVADSAVWQPDPAGTWDVAAVLHFINEYYQARPPPSDCGSAGATSSGAGSAAAGQQYSLVSSGTCAAAAGCQPIASQAECGSLSNLVDVAFDSGNGHLAVGATQQNNVASGW